MFPAPNSTHMGLCVSSHTGLNPVGGKSCSQKSRALIGGQGAKGSCWEYLFFLRYYEVLPETQLCGLGHDVSPSSFFFFQCSLPALSFPHDYGPDEYSGAVTRRLVNGENEL